MKVIKKEAEQVFTPVKFARAQKAFYDKKAVYFKLNKTHFLEMEWRKDQIFPFDEDDESVYYLESVFDPNALIVSKHPNVVEFFQREWGINCKVMQTAKVADVKGKTVYGTLPFSIAAYSEKLIVLMSPVDESMKLTYEEFKSTVKAVKEYDVKANILMRYE